MGSFLKEIRFVITDAFSSRKESRIVPGERERFRDASGPRACIGSAVLESSAFQDFIASGQRRKASTKPIAKPGD